MIRNSDFSYHRISGDRRPAVGAYASVVWSVCVYWIRPLFAMSHVVSRCSVLLAFVLVGMSVTPIAAQPLWKPHALDRPAPPVVTPAPQTLPVPPPSDALVLFDGTDLSAWEAHEGGPGAWTIANDYNEVNRRTYRPAPWTVADGAFEVAPGTGDIRTQAVFGDIQLHIEWATPSLDRVQGEGQDRGNSGVFLMGLYEIQVLDSYQSTTYPDGQAGAIYGQYPPLANASLPPTEWQAYDILFRRPRFDSNGQLTAPARITVIHNGVLIQNDAELWGVTMWLQHLPYRPHAEKLPLVLQDHGNPVRFRNIWVRELPEAEPFDTQPAAPRPAVTLSAEEMDRYVGTYGNFEVQRMDDRLRAHFFGPLWLELIPHGEDHFSLRRTDATLDFDLDGSGNPTALTFTIGGVPIRAERQ